MFWILWYALQYAQTVVALAKTKEFSDCVFFAASVRADKHVVYLCAMQSFQHARNC